MQNQNRNNQQLLNNPYGDDAYQQNQGFSQNNNNFNNNPYQQPKQQFPPNSNPNQNYPEFSNVVFNSGGNFVNDSQFVADLNPLLQQKKSKHAQALTATILLLIGQGIVLGLYFAGQIQLSIGALIGITVAIYVVYLMIALCCNALRNYLSNLDQGSKFNQVYESVKQISGKFVFNATCYHYETRYHTRTVTDSNGNSKTQTYTTQEKVITHSASEDLIPSSTKDDSGQVDSVNAMTNIIFVNYKVGYKFADSRSQNFFHGFYAGFRRRHYRDAYQDYTWKYALPPFQARRAFFVGQKNCNFQCWFYVSAFFVMLWPYSLWVQSLITRYHIQFMKILSF